MRRVAKGALAAALIGALCFAPRSHAGDRYALLIGLNHYQSAEGVVKLNYAVNDVDALAQRLTTDGYEVHKFVNEAATRQTILAELQHYAVTLKKDDTFVLFFAGHGVQQPWGAQHTFWLTYNAQLGILDDAGIRLQHLLEYVQDIPAARKLVLLDHCFSGTLGQQATTESGTGAVEISSGGTTPADAAGGRGGGASRGPSSDGFRLARAALPRTALASGLTPPSGMVVLAAAGAEAFELEKFKHGAFTEALLRAMSSRQASDGKETLTLEKLSAFVKKTVRELTNDKQEYSERSEGFRLSDWIIIDKLPIGDVDEARNKKKHYVDRLYTWANEGNIELQSVVWCEEAFDRLVKSIENNAPPDPKDQQIVNAVRGFLDVAGSPANLGPRLQSRIEEIRQAQ
jgi:hypothetical protein